MLFDLKFFKSLRLLGIITKRHFRGEKIGHRKSPNRGASAEFAEYKEYLPGDDLRFIDWNLYGRLEKLYIKKFHNEEDLNVSVLLDVSKSMGFGDPTKFDHARKIAAAVSYIAMQHQDTARIYTFSSTLETMSDGGFRRSHIHNLMGFLEGLKTDGSSDSFEDTIRHFLVKTRRPGVVFILTDGMFPGQFFEGLKRLGHRRFEVNVVQILTPEELNPPFAGLMEFLDSEDSTKISVNINKQVLTMYEEVLRETMDEMKSFLLRQGMRYFQSFTNTPFESTLLNLFAVPGGKSE